MPQSRSKLSSFITVSEDDKNLILLILVLILWTILSLSNPFIGLIGLAIVYRRLAKRFDNKEKEG